LREIRQEREICNSLRGLKVQNWVGKVTTIETNSDGKGVLGIEIADGISVATWNNAVSDMYHHTLIEPGTDFYNTISNMKRGQAIKFSGSFASGVKGACIYEESLTLEGGLRSPDFVFGFSTLSY